MAELTPKERLQPALLDRLRDDEPDKSQEAREQRVLSMRQLRESVLRDLQWLLNTGNLAATGELDQYPLIARSVLNYGIADLSGVTAIAMRGKLEGMIRQAILDFEPRILKDSVRVRVVEADQMNRNAVNIEIQGELWGQPLPTMLFLRSEIDFETGDVTVQDTGPIASR
ncbi:MAG TPA: type VI secretion system baseplate subunit TssE [Candidatus Defluviicoccus seviourii]|nr:type VI secretion system baseplate subunit TssE [Defluviicoccus sp.]MDS4071544.1 type VI secretion system baseplate subunit TssE [Defluviicoccus sp.]HOT84077.1 type VI secretion system baseplate subunit TssE [Candidatus Defluviicoccus seviourii]